jgi:hypothetical protein
MHSLEQIEKAVRELSTVEQRLRLKKLANIVESEEGSAGTEQRLKKFFSEWDATHFVTVGKKPTRQDTYADNPRLH